ncbi:NADPH-dependent oxidoreductase [Isoptericola nanjingensis]|uniref:NADPH-dependent oxidoreductase n=1 Tax=Isoptericola nanjingensis TaxID=903413 RepID=UPI003D1F5D98
MTENATPSAVAVPRPPNRPRPARPTTPRVAADLRDLRARARVAARYGVRPEDADDAAPGVAAALAASLTAAVTGAPGGGPAVLDVQLGHRSVRAFLPGPLEPWVLPTVVAAAQSAPSSSNLQLWSVVAVTDRDRLARVAALAGHQEHVRDAPLLLVWVADVARARQLGAQDGVELEAAGYLETTVVAFLDAALAAQNAVVAAESLGLGTVYVGAVRNHPEDLAAELGLPPGAVAVVGLAVGHPDPGHAPRVKPRLPQDAVLHRETYDEGRVAHVADYAPRIDAFYREERLDGSWSRRVVDRMRGGGSLQGRERLREALTALGLPSR